MLKFINEESKFYIAAPSNFASGGPELLHQLAFKLNENKKNISIYYYPKRKGFPVHKNYRHYGVNYIEDIKNVEDSEKNVLIVPEAQTQLLESFNKVKKIVWWLSVDNYFLYLPGLKGKINSFLLNRLGVQTYLFFNKKLMDVDAHLVQSHYAKNLLERKRIQEIFYLGDYLHEVFLSRKTNIKHKKNVVAYNPKKGMKFTKKLIAFCSDIDFVAIENMGREEVVETLRDSKVYIDFGFHPGKDRIPREAAFLMCCVITNKRGSAFFNEDIPINTKFKFEERDSNIPLIEKIIHDCIFNYEKNIDKYANYRAEVDQQESDFDYRLKELFG